MNQRLFQLISFFNYWLDSVDGHSLHSPFFFELYNMHVGPSKASKGINVIEALRSELLNDPTEITVEDLGAGSQHFQNQHRKIKQIAQLSLSPAKFSMLYRSLIRQWEAKTVVELGTSLGINALYMSHGTSANTYTFEGSANIAHVAKRQFEKLNASNISIIGGNIDKSLPEFLTTIEAVDFALVDANHRYSPTLNYFELMRSKAHRNTVVVMDDIHYSQEMEKAWREIISRDDVYGSVDLFRCGLVFFDPSLNRQHFVLQF